MGNIISCRTGVFGSTEQAFRNFPEAGVFHAEAPPPADGDYQALAALAKSCGVSIASLATQLNVESEETMAPLFKVINGASLIGVPKIFVSAKTGERTAWETTTRRLRHIAEYASARDVVVCMETHPPLGENGDKALRTLSAVGHEGLRLNFDTANIYYYNEGTNTLDELRKVADYVGSVHLKDTDGGFKSAKFPPLGQGVVDFAGVFRILDRVGFTGPYTLEIEGDNVAKLDEEGRRDFLRQCVAFLKANGAMTE